MRQQLDYLPIEAVCALKAVRSEWLSGIDFVLRNLEDEGLIEWKERAWTLTEAGRFAN